MNTNPTCPPLDVREPIAKMRAQAEANRKRAAELAADAQRFWAEAQATHSQIIAQAEAQQAEAAFWEGLAAEQEAKAGLTALDAVPADTTPTQQDGGEV